MIESEYYKRMHWASVGTMRGLGEIIQYLTTKHKKGEPYALILVVYSTSRLETDSRSEALVQMLTWRRTGSKPISESLMVRSSQITRKG